MALESELVTHHAAPQAAKEAPQDPDTYDGLSGWLLIEAGRVISGKNEAALRKAVGELQAILNQLARTEPATEPEAEPMTEAALMDVEIREMSSLTEGPE